MTITKEAFVDLEEKYNKVIKLIEEDSKLDPETEPFLSKYNARQILIGMKANLENLIRIHSTENEDNLKLTAMSAAVQLYLGLLALSVDELSTGEKHLEKCREIIANDELKPEMVMVTLKMYNEFGILWYQREPAKSKVYLEKAQEIYTSFKTRQSIPLNIKDLFQTNPDLSNEDALKNFENLYTLTLYYLAQVYGALLDVLKSSVYCHRTLQRQFDAGEYDPIDWALNSATLSQFFMEKNGFKQARHHLAASSFILSNYKKQLDEIIERDEAYDAKIETFKHRSADVARCWTKYGILLLGKSKQRLLNHTDDIDVHCSLTTDLTKLDLNDSTVSSADIDNLDFVGIDASLFENNVTDQFVLTLEDARKVFSSTQVWIAKAQEYYSLDSLASDFIEIVQDQSQLYVNLLFFEDNPENQSKLHKRRADLLENVLDKVNPRYYLSFCRQIWFELAHVYFDILDIKLEKLRATNDRPKPQALTKVNHLVDKSISHHRHFIDSYREPDSQLLPSKIGDEAEVPFLQAHAYIGALYNKFITLDKAVQLKNIECSLQHYKFVVEYCDRNVKAKEGIPAEYAGCKNMVDLMEIKIAQVEQKV